MLTQLQREVLDFIGTYSGSHGYAPSYADIMASTGHKSKSNIHRIVNVLVTRGFVRNRKNEARSLEVVRKSIGFTDELKANIEECGVKAILNMVAVILDEQASVTADAHAAVLRQAIEGMV